jgi:dihydropteroate synthase
VEPPGVRLICADVPAATAALDAGVPRAAILVATEPPGVAAALAAGWDVVADVDPPRPEAADTLPGQAAAATQITPRQQNAAAPPGEADEVSGAVAAAAVCAWLGVAAVRTRHIREVRRALDMTASIRGLRPPAWAVRGLA